MIPPQPIGNGISLNFLFNNVVHFAFVLKFLGVLPIQFVFTVGEGEFHINQLRAIDSLNDFVFHRTFHHLLLVFKQKVGAYKRKKKAGKKNYGGEFFHKVKFRRKMISPYTKLSILTTMPSKTIFNHLNKFSG